jgi:gas vesicle protein
MIFRRSKKRVKQGMGSMDKLITGIIIGGAAASIFGLSRTPKWQKITQKFLDKSDSIVKKWIRKFWKITVQILWFFDKK